MGMKGVLYVGSALGNEEETHLDASKHIWINQIDFI